MGSQLHHSPYIVLVESRRKWLLLAGFFAVPLGFCRREKTAKVIYTIFNLEAKQVYFGKCPCSFWRDGRRGACAHPPVAKFFAFY